MPQISNPAKLIIINFNQAIAPDVLSLATKSKITFYHSNVIYHLMDKIKQDLADLMPVDELEEEVGEAEVLAVFQRNWKEDGKTTPLNPYNAKEGLVAGCRIKSGTMNSADTLFEVYRDGALYYTSFQPQLFFKSNKVDEIELGEFGCSLEDVFSKDSRKGFLPGDIIKCIAKESSKREVTWEWS